LLYIPFLKAKERWHKIKLRQSPIILFLIKIAFALPATQSNKINFIILNNWYILIIPGFGIVSHIVSTFSGKSIFGLNGLIYQNDNLNQTICRKLSEKIFY
jgi:hypothetical protein